MHLIKYGDFNEKEQTMAEEKSLKKIEDLRKQINTTADKARFDTN